MDEEVDASGVVAAASAEVVAGAAVAGAAAVGASAVAAAEDELAESEEDASEPVRPPVAPEFVMRASASAWVSQVTD